MASEVKIILDAVNKASDDFKKVGKDAKKMGDEFDKANKKSKKSGAELVNSLKGVAVAAGAVGGSLIAVGIAAKKAFEFGKEGAAIRQTTESFDMLLDKVGAAPDILNQLRDASNNTIDDMSLMSSTLTLVAGASDSMAGAMLDAAPKLLEIAKAANKLNPALGSTAKMYSDIMTGVKRSQPLILDNLGLTLKIGDSNKAAADALGKTVEQLTAEEKAMAILNATLDAGNVMIEQVGESTDSATDSFAQFETSIKNAGDAMKAGFSEPASDVVVELTRLADEFASTQEVYAEYDRAVKDGIITQEQMAKSFADVANKGLTQEEAIGRLTAQMRFWADGIPPVNISLGLLDDNIDKVGESAEDAAGGASDFGKALDEIYEAWRGISNLGSLESKIKGFWEELEYKKLGYDEFEADLAAIQSAVMAGQIDEGLAQELTMGAAAGAEAISHAAGNVTFEEARQNLVDAFGIGAKQAGDLLRDAIGRQDYTIYVDAVITSVSGGGTGAGSGRTGDTGDDGDTGDGNPDWESFTVPPSTATTAAATSSGVTVTVNTGDIASGVDVEEMAWTVARRIQEGAH